MRVTKGSLDITKRVREKGLYVFQGSAVIDDTMVVMEPRQTFLVSFWHKRLAQVSDKRLKDLSKMRLFESYKLGNLEFVIIVSIVKPRE